MEDGTTGSLRGCLYANHRAGLLTTVSAEHIRYLKYSAYTTQLLMEVTFTGRLHFCLTTGTHRKDHPVTGVNSEM